MDKAGNFIGWLHIDGVNLSVALVENALSKVHFTAERSAYYKTLVTAEEACRQRKEKVRLIEMLRETRQPCVAVGYQGHYRASNGCKTVFIKHPCGETRLDLFTCIHLAHNPLR